MQINTILIRTDALYCSFQRDTMQATMQAAAEEVERQDRYVRDGISDAPYEKMFISVHGELREIPLERVEAWISTNEV